MTTLLTALALLIMGVAFAITLRRPRFLTSTATSLMASRFQNYRGLFTGDSTPDVSTPVGFRQPVSLFNRSQSSKNPPLSRTAELKIQLTAQRLKLLTAASELPTADNVHKFVDFLQVHRELAGDADLAASFASIWQREPRAATLPLALHLCAVSEAPVIFEEVLQAAIKRWRRGELVGISASELLLIFDTHFWLLSSEARTSGAGFCLKQTLSAARGELSHRSQSLVTPNPATT